jgi:dipeptidase E
VSRILLLSELHPALDDFVAGAGLVGVLPDAGDAIGEPEIAEQARAHLRRAGAHLVDVDLDGDVAAQLTALDVLVATGGDPSALASRLRRTGAGALVVDAVREGLRYAGLSAGAMVAGPSLSPHLDVDVADLPPGDALRGLELTRIHVLVHHGRRGRDGLHARALERHGVAATLVPLADADGIVLRNGEPELFGPQRGERLRSALPGDVPALTALLDDVDWAERVAQPGVVVLAVDGEVRGLLEVGRRTLTSLGVFRGAPDAARVEARLRAWAVAATT